MLIHHSLESLNDSRLLSQFGDLVRQDHEGNAESTAVKRIGAARAARRFPVLFTMAAWRLGRSGRRIRR